MSLVPYGHHNKHRVAFPEQKLPRLPDGDARRYDVVEQDDVRFHGVAVQDELRLDAAPVFRQHHIFIEWDTQLLFRSMWPQWRH